MSENLNYENLTHPEPTDNAHKPTKEGPESKLAKFIKNIKTTANHVLQILARIDERWANTPYYSEIESNQNQPIQMSGNAPNRLKRFLGIQTPETLRKPGRGVKRDLRIE